MEKKPRSSCTWTWWRTQQAEKAALLPVPTAGGSASLMGRAGLGIATTRLHHATTTAAETTTTTTTTMTGMGATSPEGAAGALDCSEASRAHPRSRSGSGRSRAVSTIATATMEWVGVDTRLTQQASRSSRRHVDGAVSVIHVDYRGVLLCAPNHADTVHAGMKLQRVGRRQAVTQLQLN
jgi:hypothetical protein